MVHRDIKPQNVLVTIDGLCKLTDFGTAAKIRELQEGPPRLVGTPMYMSPEQCRGESCGPETDIWAFGILLGEISTGVVPWSTAAVEAKSTFFLLRIATDESMRPTFQRDLDPEILEIATRCTQRDASRRPTAIELLQSPFFRS